MSKKSSANKILEKLFQRLNLSKLLYSIKRNKRTLILFLKAKTLKLSSNKLYLYYKGVNGYHLPYSSKYQIDDRILFLVSQNFSKWMLKKYTVPNYQFRETDVVIDCGAFVGAFTVAAAQAGVKKIYSIEPSSKNFSCLKLNIDHYNVQEKVVPINIGLAESPGVLKLNLSQSGCDDSFLKPDKGDLGTVELVETNTLANLIFEYNLELSNLFLKVEAEGFEPEVIYGLGPLKPRIIVIDVSPERSGQSPKDELEKYLINNGYKITITRKCLFAEYLLI